MTGELQARSEQSRHERRNFACLVWMGSVFAMGWSEVMVVLQPMLVHYGATNTQIGLVQGTLIATLPGMVAVPWVTRFFRFKKWLVYVCDMLYLLPIGLVGAAVWGGWIASPSGMVWLIMLLMLAGQVAAGFGGLPNQEFFTACIPMRLRGRLAGFSAGIGGALGLVSTGVAAWVLGKYPVPQAYGMLLVLAWALCVAADSAVLLAKEPPTPVERSPRPWSRDMWRALAADTAFLRVAGCVCLLSPLLGQVAIFSSAFAFRELHFEAQMAAWLGMVASGARILASPIAGWVTDRQGARPALIGWSALGVSGFALLAAMPVAGTVFVVAGLAAVAGSGFSGAMNALTCGLPAAEHRAGHFTVLGFGMVITNAAAPPLIGKLLDSVPFAFGCGILAVLGALVVAGAWWVTRGLSARASDYR